MRPCGESKYDCFPLSLISPVSENKLTTEKSLKDVKNINVNLPLVPLC